MPHITYIDISMGPYAREPLGNCLSCPCIKTALI